MTWRHPTSAASRQPTGSLRLCHIDRTVIPVVRQTVERGGGLGESCGGQWLLASTEAISSRR